MLWRLKVMSFDGHTTNVTSLGFQREGKWMYTGSEDGTVKIWDLRFVVVLANVLCGCGAAARGVAAAQ